MSFLKNPMVKVAVIALVVVAITFRVPIVRTWVTGA